MGAGDDDRRHRGGPADPRAAVDRPPVKPAPWEPLGATVGDGPGGAPGAAAPPSARAELEATTDDGAEPRGRAGLGATGDGAAWGPASRALGATGDGAAWGSLGATGDGAARGSLGATVDGEVVRAGARALDVTRDGPGSSRGSGVELAATTDGPATSRPGGLGATTDSQPTVSSGLREADAPERLGRYLVIKRLGAGGMGVVYKAYDPALDRRVAVKLLRGRESGQARARLLREAQAMARLSHPNVVPVFDVGTVDEQVFVAMDFVDGEDLHAWLAERRPWQEVLDVFLQAGAGLAAAHAVGLVHRDFKPDNVLLSRDPATGRLRAQVADFGLARRDDEQTDEPVDAEFVLLSRASMLDQGLTRVGAVVGTPLYMSPEQHLGASVDPRSDQFSFCVALFEGLYGERPFAGDTVEALALAASSPRRRPPPPGSRVPGWLHRLCLRGLQPDREARFPGMDALLAEAARRRVQGRNRWLAVGGAALVAAAVGGAALRGDAAATLCTGGPDRLAGAWDDARRDAAGRAFAATGRPFAGDAWAASARAVDEYAAAWLAMYRDNCEATQVRGEQSAEAMDLRAACLGRRLQDLAALTALYAGADDQVVKRAVDAAQGLPPLDGCADPSALRSGAAAPPAEVAAEVEALRGKLAEARTLRRAGKGKEALELAAPVAEAAEELHFPPLLAEARIALGDAQVQAGEHEPAVPALVAGVGAALAAGDADLLFDGLLLLHDDLGYNLGRDKEAAPWAELARGALARAGDRPRDVGRLLVSEALVDIAAGRHAEAEAALLRSTALLTDAYGRDYPALVSHYNALGAVYLRTGKYAEGQAMFERSLALAEASKGPRHPDVAFPLNNLALAYERQARYEDAVAALRRALDIFARTSGADHPNVGLLHQNIGGMLRLAGDLPQARAELDQGLAILEAKLGPEHPQLGAARTMSGDVALDQGDLARARVDYTAADELRRKALGEDHPDRALALLGLGKLELAEGKPAAAAAALERALALMAASTPDPVDAAEVRAALARARWDTGDRAGARALAEAARAGFVEGGATARRQLAALEAWLAAHPPT
jgi:tetratricopeptide (TPR) repeat protein